MSWLKRRVRRLLCDGAWRRCRCLGDTRSHTIFLGLRGPTWHDRGDASLTEFRRVQHLDCHPPIFARKILLAVKVDDVALLGDLRVRAVLDSGELTFGGSQPFFAELAHGERPIRMMAKNSGQPGPL